MNVFLPQAELNRTINEAWIRVLSEYSIAEIDADQGAFFGSIFGTLNHILLGDRIWLGRIRGEPFAFEKTSDRLCSTLVEFAEERKRTDKQLVCVVREERDFSRIIEYRNSSGKSFQQPLHEILTHLIAHQHHHRGQVSQMCHERGIPIPDGGTIGYTR